MLCWSSSWNEALFWLKFWLLGFLRSFWSLRYLYCVLVNFYHDGGIDVPFRNIFLNTWLASYLFQRFDHSQGLLQKLFRIYLNFSIIGYINESYFLLVHSLFESLSQKIGAIIIVCPIIFDHFLKIKSSLLNKNLVIQRVMVWNLGVFLINWLFIFAKCLDIYLRI